MTKERISAAEYRQHVKAGTLALIGATKPVRHKAGTPNKTEEAYALYVLEPRKRAGEIRDYHFGRLTLKLADDTRYTPDYFVELADGSLELHEVKGFWRDDARVKYNVAREMFPMFRFRVVKRIKREWVIV